MKVPMRLFFMVLVLTILVSAFQNCSVYKSEDRKFFERNGAVSSASTTSGGKALLETWANAGDIVQPDCRPYLSLTETDRLFKGETETRLFYDRERQALTCVVSSVENSEAGTDTAVCTISQGNLDLVHALASGDGPDIIADPHPAGPLSLGSFGFVRSHAASNIVQLTFVGAELGAKEAAACTFTLEALPKYVYEQSQLIARASHLVHQIVAKMR